MKRALFLFLMVLPALAHAQGVQYEPRVGGGSSNIFAPYPGRVSSVIAAKSFNAGTDNYPSDLASPTFDCVASTSGEMTCSGATATKTGSPTTGTSPFWWRGATSVSESVVLNGSSDYYNLGNLDAEPQSLTVCAVHNLSSTAGVMMLVGNAAAPTYSWYLGNNSGITLRVCKSGPVCSSSGVVAASTGWAVSCASYLYVADGTSVLRVNSNGTASTPVTTAVGPIAISAGAVQIGADGAAGSKINGSIRRVSIWTGTAFSATDLARLVASQWGLTEDKPSTDYATHARTDSTLCCPFSDAECYWVGPGAPCIHAPTYSGWAGSGGGVEVYGVGANGATYSETLTSWSTSGATVTTLQAGTPNKHLVTTSANNGSVYQTATTASSTQYTLSGWVAAASGSTVQSIGVQCGSGNATACTCGRGNGAACTTGINASVQCYAYSTFTTTQDRFWLSATCASASTAPIPFVHDGQYVATNGVTGYFGGMQITATAQPMPYRATTGSAYSGSAGTATTLSVPVRLTDPSRWAVGVSAILPLWTSGTLWGLGTNAGANSASLLTGATDGTLRTYDGASGTLTSTWTHGLAAGSSHALVGGAPAAVRVDGAPVTLSTSGTGTGIATLPATLYVGQTSAGSQTNGLVSRVVQCRSAGGCR
jgi:hypothetical protein